MDNTFGVNIIPENDQERIAVLRRYKILDTPPERAFDNVAQLAARIFHVPIALISLVDAEKVFFKANIGMETVKSSDRGSSLCSLAILHPEVTIFEDALKEPCLLANPLVAGDFGLKFYAGAPLITPDGFMIGTFCIKDKKTRSFSKQDEEILKDLAKIVMDEIELRLSAINETEEQQALNEELSTTIEELAAANEELLHTNEELSEIHKSLHHTVAKLAESENRFRNMIECAPVAMLVLRGEDMVFELANPMMLQLLKKGPEVIGLTLSQALPEIVNQPILDVLYTVYHTGEPYYGFERPVILNRNGVEGTGYFDFVYTPLIENGKITGVLQVVTEITEQVEIRKALQKAEEMLRFSIEAANVGTWYFDIGAETFQPSSSLKKLFGYAVDEEMTYQHILAQINDDYRGKVIAAASGTIYKGANYSVEFPATGFHDQKVRWLKAIGKLDHDAAGRLSHFSGVVIEITEQKQDEIRKNDFIAMVSHELKTPLTSLKGYMQLLTGKAKKTDDAFTINALERGNTQITKMTAMINGFLNVSRLEAGKIHLEKLPFRLEQLMRDIVDEVMMTTQSHDIVLLPFPPLMVNADSDKIGQVINNFLSNAVKYSPLHSRIEVTACLAGNMVQVSVKDQGMGISPEDTDKLFDRFYRVENRHAQNISGFGIGLYLCAEIVHRHDGHIWVNSETGKGSAFYFSIPNYTTA